MRAASAEASVTKTTGVRAEPVAYGSTEMVELELHLAVRAMGMPVETPAVRP